MELPYELDCVCNRVPYEQIRKIIINKNCKNIKELQQHCMVGNRCGCCVFYIENYIKDYQENKI